MPYIALTLFEGNVPVAVNTDNIDFVSANSSRSKINFASGQHLHVTESYEQVTSLLPGYVAPVALVADETVDLAVTPGEEAAASGAAADAANPAKSRQTK